MSNTGELHAVVLSDDLARLADQEGEVLVPGESLEEVIDYLITNLPNLDALHVARQPQTFREIIVEVNGETAQLSEVANDFLPAGSEITISLEA